MPSWNLPNAAASHAFHALDSFTQGFLGSAFDDARACGAAPCSGEFFTAEATHDREEGRSDGVIPSDSDLEHIPAEDIARVAEFCANMRKILGADLDAACRRPGYDMNDAGSDLYMTIVGHGVGYWSREALEDDSEEYEELTADMRDASESGDEPTWQAAFDARARLTTKSLGDRLSEACGRGEIYLYAEGDAEAFVVRFDCLYSSALKD